MYYFSTLATPSLQVEILSDPALALGNHLRSFCPHVRRAASTVRAPRTRSLARCGWRCGCKCEALRCRSWTPRRPLVKVLCFFVVLIDAMLLCVVGLHVTVRLPCAVVGLLAVSLLQTRRAFYCLCRPLLQALGALLRAEAVPVAGPAPSPSSSSALEACRQ